MVVGNLWYYFGQYTPGSFFLEANSEAVDRAGRYLRDLGGEYWVYFAGAPRIYFDSPTITFLAPAVKGQDVLEPVSGELDCERETQRAVFIFTPERAGEMLAVREGCPEGIVREFNSETYGLLFAAYELH
jgi:hypothetical protein